MGSVVTFDVCLKTQRMKSSTPAGDDIRVNSCPAVCSERSADRTKERHLVVGSFEVLQKPGATCVQHRLQRRLLNASKSEAATSIVTPWL